MKQKRFLLEESELPREWYNIQAEMPMKPMPSIHPQTREPLGVDDLAQIFPRECCVQELDTEHAWIPIPEEVLEKYKYYRSTPLVRAYALEEALGTPAHIYYKNESACPLGSHKINSALPQCYYAKQEGTTNVTTETGAGQWGAALSYAASVFGLEAAVYQVKISMQQKPYRSSIMRTFGAAVTGSIHARLGAQPRGTAPDRHRTRGRKADGEGWRISRRGDCLLRWRFELRRPRLPVYAPQSDG